MSDGFEVLWTETARRDLSGIARFIAEDSVAAALGAIRRIEEAAAALCTVPERGRIVPELRDQGVSRYRELVVAPWRVVYRVEEQRVYVLSALDSRRNLEDILLDRLVGID